MNKEDFIPVKDYANKMGVSVQYIYTKIKDQTLNSYKMNNLTYVEDKEDLKAESKEEHNFKPLIKEGSTSLIENLKNQVEYFKEESLKKDSEIKQLNENLSHYQEKSKEELKELQNIKDKKELAFVEMLNNQTQQLIAQALKTNNNIDHQEVKEDIIETDHHEAEIIEEPEPIELNKHLKELKYKKEYRKKVIKKAQKALLKDSSRFLLKDNKIFIYPDEHKYKDLF